MIKEILTKSVKETQQVAETIGRSLQGSEVIELVGDVGAGKTTFVHGLAKGIGSPDRVSSPTFTIYKLYSGGRYPIYHYDLYRLQHDSLVQSELAERVSEDNTVLVLEWAEHVQSVLPENHLTIKFESPSEESRKLFLDIPDSLEYIRDNL